MCETLVIKFRKPLTIINCLAHDEHRGESQLVIVDYLSQILELATIDFLIRPSQVIAGSYGRILRVLLRSSRCTSSTIEALRKMHIVL